MNSNWFGRFPAMVDLHPAFDRIFDEFFRDVSRFSAAPYPPVNVREEEDSLVVTAEVPGVDPESLDVKVQGDVLVLAGSRSPVVEEDSNAKLLRQERGFGQFTREINLPVKVDGSGVEARCDLGVLTVTLPKAPEARPRLIQVKAN